jgi:hypothetical protein
MQPLDPKTTNLVKLMMSLVTRANQHQMRYALGGGLALDISLGRLTRPHEDIDMIISIDDVALWQRQFIDEGYEIGHDEYMRYFPYSFTVVSKDYDRDNYLIEVWPMEFKPDGSLYPPHTSDHPGRNWWASKNVKTWQKISYDGVQVWIESPAEIIKQKLDHVRFHKEALAAKHLHDLELHDNLSDYQRLLQELKIT